MSRMFKALMATAILASMVIAPAAAQAGDHKDRTPDGPDCVKFQDFGAATLSGTTANGLSITLTDFEYDGSNELKAFSWTANGEATLHVKASTFITDSGAAMSGRYEQGETDDFKTHAISHITFCGTAGGGGDGGDPPVTTIPDCTGDAC